MDYPPGTHEGVKFVFDWFKFEHFQSLRVKLRVAQKWPSLIGSPDLRWHREALKYCY